MYGMEIIVEFRTNKSNAGLFKKKTRLDPGVWWDLKRAWDLSTNICFTVAVFLSARTKSWLTAALKFREDFSLPIEGLQSGIQAGIYIQDYQS